MAHGRPALVADIGGLLETVESNVSGWTVPPNDAAALARTLAEIVAQPQGWCSFGRAARMRFETLVAASIIARQLQMVVGARLTVRGTKESGQAFGAVHVA